MRGCLFTVLLGAVAVVLLVTVGLPSIAAGMLTGVVATAGLHADDTTVTVSSDPPTDLVGLHADQVRISATDATFRGLGIGSLRVTLTGVDLLGRTATSVDGRLSQVVVPGVASKPLTLATIRLSGGGDTITATTTIPAAQAKTLVADSVEAALGVRPTSVALTAPDEVRVTEAGATIHGRLSVTSSGDLIADVLDGPAAGQQLVVVARGQDFPIRLSSVTVTSAGGLRLSGALTVGLFG